MRAKLPYYVRLYSPHPDGGLSATGHKTVRWPEDGDPRATCNSPRHQPPDQSCECGYYCTRNLWVVLSRLDTHSIPAIVVPYGKCYEDKYYTCRSERQAIVGIWRPRDDVYVSWLDPRWPLLEGDFASWALDVAEAPQWIRSLSLKDLTGLASSIIKLRVFAEEMKNLTDRHSALRRLRDIYDIGSLRR